MKRTLVPMGTNGNRVATYTARSGFPLLACSLRIDDTTGVHRRVATPSCPMRAPAPGQGKSKLSAISVAPVLPSFNLMAQEL
jgi:hypothetical protein